MVEVSKGERKVYYCVVDIIWYELIVEIIQISIATKSYPFGIGTKSYFSIKEIFREPNRG